MNTPARFRQNDEVSPSFRLSLKCIVQGHRPVLHTLRIGFRESFLKGINSFIKTVPLSEVILGMFRLILKRASRSPSRLCRK